jgi:hypothetical protein
MHKTLALFAIGAGVLASTACASTGSTSTSSSEAQSPPLISNAVPQPSSTLLERPSIGPKPRAWLDAGSDSGSLIYVAAGSQVRIFPETGFNPAQIGAITDHVNSAYGLFVDGDRNLYVANAETISAYHRGSLDSWIVYPDRAGPLYVVKDHAGRLYAANRNGSVTEYPPRQRRPDRTLHTPGVEADGINLDDADNLYVAYRDQTGMGSIEKFRPNSRRGRVLGMQLDQPQGLQLDHSGNILVVESGKGAVDIFPPGSTSPSQIVEAGLGVTQVVLREAGDDMYVSNWKTGNVYISHYPPGEFQPKIETDSGMQGIALSNEER